MPHVGRGYPLIFERDLSHNIGARPWFIPLRLEGVGAATITRANWKYTVGGAVSDRGAADYDAGEIVWQFPVQTNDHGACSYKVIYRLTRLANWYKMYVRLKRDASESPEVLTVNDLTRYESFNLTANYGSWVSGTPEGAVMSWQVQARPWQAPGVYADQ